MKTLILGCSFCSTLAEDKPEQWKLNPDVTVRAISGTGNEALAARTIYECARVAYDRVIVIWTGINRLDARIPRILHETYPGAKQEQPEYSFCTPLQSEVWYHSGGILGSWTTDKTCPRAISQYFKNQYLAATANYMCDISLAAIATTQHFLTASGITYEMSFIYDIAQDYSDIDNGRWENVLGKVISSGPYFDLVDWHKIKTDTTPYEWAKHNASRLENDQFHPTRDAMRTWILDNFFIDIAA